jgi:hypothetical protein
VRHITYIDEMKACPPLEGVRRRSDQMNGAETPGEGQFRWNSTIPDYARLALALFVGILSVPWLIARYCADWSRHRWRTSKRVASVVAWYRRRHD